MGTKITLAIGDKNYSSWSLRPWLVMRQAKVQFEEVIFPLQENSLQDLSISSNKVPVLYHEHNVIWDSLSICEYINELFPQSFLWPQNADLRALARSVCAEMHSSFLNLRKECKMDMKRSEFKALSKEAERDIKRIYELWLYCKNKSGSKEYLFGHFTIADAFFAPVVSRIISYQIPMEGNEDYIHLISNNRFYKEWKEEGIKNEQSMREGVKLKQNF